MLNRFDIGYDRVPDPVNLFQHVGFGERGAWEFRPPLSERDDLVTFRAEMDLLLAVASSADDISDRNDHSLTRYRGARLLWLSAVHVVRPDKRGANRRTVARSALATLGALITPIGGTSWTSRRWT